jgi:hypothetical protein
MNSNSAQILQKNPKINQSVVAASEKLANLQPNQTQVPSGSNYTLSPPLSGHMLSLSKKV